ncbi:tetratricopeptide repeat protein [Nafulsella turpanensis]|uniref:tetratricopeptide repeat protein n=1 Tax=Nafulsella turpanensis TaxID=1265690 RepID=UPI00034D8AE7|nr:tetratricopeptide repeat protein [Nafulsella turpanensis]
MRSTWLFVFLFCSRFLFAGSSTGTDSLQNLLQNELPDTLRLQVLNELAFQTSTSDLSSSLTYAEEGLLLAESLKDRRQKRQILHLMGIAHHRLGNYDQTLSYFRQVLRMFEEDENLSGIGAMYNNLGILYRDIKNHQASLEYYQKALSIKQQLGDSSAITSTLSNIGIAFMELGQYDKAYRNFTRSLNIDRKLQNVEGQMYTCENLGKLFSQQAQYDSAGFYLHQSLALLPEEGREYEHSLILNSLAQLYLAQKKAQTAVKYLKKAIDLGNKVQSRTALKESYKMLADAYAQQLNYKRAFNCYQQYIALKDSIFNEENLERISQIETNYQLSKREKEIEILKKDARISHLQLSRNQMVNYYLYTGLFLLISVSFFLFFQFKAKRNSNQLLKKTNDAIAARNLNITSSIDYARTIQETLLPQEKQLLTYFKEAFVFCKARDIVNGDFYWCYKKGDNCLLAVIDCTGHGVPGALMTVMVNSLLNQIVIDKHVYSPAEILNQLRQYLRQNLRQEQETEISADGLDLAICSIDTKEKQVTFASAKRPLYLVQHHELRVYKGNKTTFGGPLSQPAEQFREGSFYYLPGSCLYLFTDGITDQFGEASDKKFMHWRLQELIKENYEFPMQQQKRKIAGSIEQWQGKLEQTDDMLLLGIRLP